MRVCSGMGQQLHAVKETTSGSCLNVRAAYKRAWLDHEALMRLINFIVIQDGGYTYKCSIRGFFCFRYTKYVLIKASKVVKSVHPQKRHYPHKVYETMIQEYFERR